MNFNTRSSIRIDLRSDTATRPSAAMLARMLAADVGDEQLGEDPTTRMLEERSADLLGHEAALFLPTGTMCNQIALLLHCRPGDEVIAARVAHIYNSEGAGAAALAGALVHPIASSNGIFTGSDLTKAVRPYRPRAPRSRLVVIEQTSNRGGGAVWPISTVRSIVEGAHAHGLSVHMDGARLFNAVVASGTSAADFGRCCDSVWIDFSKGLGCPFGAVLAGSKSFIAEAWRWKHRLGGAMRQSGFMAAACLYALDHNVDRLAEDHSKARRFAARLFGSNGIKSPFSKVETNILFLDFADAGVSAPAVVQELRKQGIGLSLEGPSLARAVTHLDIGERDVEEAAEIVATTVATLSRTIATA